MYFRVTILILIDGFLQYEYIKNNTEIVQKVTILILIDGFLQYTIDTMTIETGFGHNPYFNRWFSAIYDNINNQEAFYSHNPYFNRWFSAITNK